MAVLTFDGKRTVAAGGALVLYMHPGGILYTDKPPAEDGPDFVFEARRTLMVQFQNTGGGQIAYALARGDQSFGRPTLMRIPRGGCARQDCTDAEFLRRCTEALTGLTLPQAGGGMPGGAVN